MNSKFKIKGYKSIRGNEGDAFEANIYRGNKRVGEAYYDGWGGPFTITFTDETAAQEFRDEAVSHCRKDVPDLAAQWETLDKWGGADEVYLDELIGRMLEEREFLKLCRKPCAYDPNEKAMFTRRGQWSKLEAQHRIKLRAQCAEQGHILMNDLSPEEARAHYDEWRTTA